MSKTQGQAWPVVGILALLSGCASNINSMVADLGDRDSVIELESVPFYSQVTDQCGPAALASVLNDAGIAVSAEDLRSRVYIPERAGSLQLELTAATRHFGRIPYEVDSSPSALVDELEAGRPVLVLQNLGISMVPIWHYAVVVGYLPASQQFVLRSGDRERLLMGAKAFTGTWKRGRYWAIVALRPGELPANVLAEQFLRSVAATESAGNLDNPIPAYRVATERWPDNNLAWLGFGNALYAEGELLDAARAYQNALQIRSGDAVTMNNLSQVYLQLGCRDGALATITTALTGVDESDPVRAHLLVTHREVQQSDAESQCLL